MKTRTLIIMSIFLLAVTFLFADDVKKEITDEDFMEAWCVTWINTDYGGGNTGQKIIIQPEGTREIFGMLTSTIVSQKEKFTILDQWLDSEGTIWYRGHWECLIPYSSKGYEMGKINYAGNTWEVIFASESYPIKEWEPDRFEYNYRIYYRQ